MYQSAEAHPDPSQAFYLHFGKILTQLPENFKMIS